MHLTDAEVHAIAKLFIQELIPSLNGKLIAGALNTLRHGEEMEENVYNRDLPFPTPRYKECELGSI